MPVSAKSVADIEGPWVDPPFESGLIQRCRNAWNTPANELSNEELATFLRQRIALSLIVPEARCRLDAVADDGTEMYDGDLANALGDAEVAYNKNV
jgi:hypothetical protein